MANAIRSQLVLQEMEEKMEELLAMTEQRHSDVKEELTQIQDSMSVISWQLMELLHHNTSNPKGNYQAPTKFTKMDLLRFMKDDVVGWISKCQNCFDLDKTPENNKVTMVSLMIDEVGYQWYDGLKKNSRDSVVWQVFSEGLRVRFRTSLRRPLEELVQLKQTDSLNDYQEKFERIAYRSNLTKEQNQDCYLGGLKDELAWDVRLFNPRTVLQHAWPELKNWISEATTK